MKHKLIAAFLVGATLMLPFSGCQTNSLSEPTVKMKTVTQNDDGDNATFEFEIPEDWVAGTYSTLSLGTMPEAMYGNKDLTTADVCSYIVFIDEYYYMDYGIYTTEEKQQLYKDLFAGKTETYEEYIKTKATIRGVFGSLKLIKGDFQATNFEYKHHQGKDGKILEVRYSWVCENETVQTVRYYREDIPYVVTGAFSDSVELPSGEVAPWVVNSLKVTENYKNK